MTPHHEVVFYYYSPILVLLYKAVLGYCTVNLVMESSNG